MNMKKTSILSKNYKKDFCEDNFGKEVLGVIKNGNEFIGNFLLRKPFCSYSTNMKKTSIVSKNKKGLL